MYRKTRDLYLVQRALHHRHILSTTDVVPTDPLFLQLRGITATVSLRMRPLGDRYLTAGYEFAFIGAIRLVEADGAPFGLPEQLARVPDRVDAGYLQTRPALSLAPDGVRQVSRFGARMARMGLGAVLVAAWAFGVAPAGGTAPGAGAGLFGVGLGLSWWAKQPAGPVARRLRLC
jgi:hypothetical protein